MKCEHCGAQPTPQHPFVSHSVEECRVNLRAQVDHWKAKWEDLEINRAVCCDKMETALREIVVGKTSQDEDSVLDTYAHMSQRLVQIAQDALSAPLCQRPASAHLPKDDK